MLWEKSFTKADAKTACADLVEAWNDPSNKVFVLRAAEPIAEVRSFYESLLPDLGTPEPLAEDVTLGERNTQRNGQIWFEVRYDPRHPDAYRHSPNAQPLHTDGSYIPSFPNATLMICVAAAGSGGETVFLSPDDLEKAVAEEDWNLLQFLKRTPIPHARSGDRRIEPVVREEDGRKLLNWNYYCVDRRAAEAHQEQLDKFQRILTTSSLISKSLLNVKLSPGDAVTWRDDELLHGRNAFHASQESERFLWKCAIDIGRFSAN